MAAARRHWAADLLHFWFHELGPQDWFATNAAVDAELRRRFGALLPGLSRQRPETFLTAPRDALAAVLLFDQTPRNLFRDSPKAFAFDPLAQAICKAAIAKGWDMALPKRERHFLYMPLMHSEAIADQRLSLRKFVGMESAFLLGFARAHARMIARFGRYPHRNDVLGRKSTPAEERAVAAGFSW